MLDALLAFTVLVLSATVLLHLLWHQRERNR